jgi:predicted TPR repeat methyltransferase
VEGLNYSAPQKLLEVVTELTSKGAGSGVYSHVKNGEFRSNFKTVLDVGCGTGLCGPLFKNLSEVCTNLLALSTKKRGVGNTDAAAEFRR